MAMTVNSNADNRSGNVIYLADFRKRIGSVNEPTDPRPGSAAARPVELSFLSVIGSHELRYSRLAK
jgi:hypothetical protein